MFKLWIKRIKTLSLSQFFLLSLLSFILFLSSVQVVWFDSLSNALYLGTFGKIDLNFNFILSGLFLIPSGMLCLSFERRFGRGVELFFGVAFVVQLFILFTIFRDVRFSADILFILRFLYRACIFSSVWSLIFRYVPLDMQSKRFFCLVCLNLFGLFVGGLSLPLFFHLMNTDFLFLVTFLMTAVLFLPSYLALRVFKFKNPIVLKKNGGVSEKSQQTLLRLILVASFFFSASKCLLEYFFCLVNIESFSFSFDKILFSYAWMWSAVGFLSLISLFVLYRFRHSFHVMTGMTMLACLPFVGQMGIDASSYKIVFFAKVLFEVLTYFCVGYYFKAIPRPLSYAHTARLKVFRKGLLEPCGFLLSALLIYFNFSNEKFFIYPILLSFLFCITLADTYFEYAKVLISSFQSFRWRGGRLLLIHPNVQEFVIQKIRSDDELEVIYFLRVMEDAQFPLFKKYLKEVLSHSSENVRLFALKTIEKWEFQSFLRDIERIFQTDKSDKVRSKALRLLCLWKKKYAVETAVLYLEDSSLRYGALTGLIENGGSAGVQIVSDYFDKMLQTQNVSDKLEILQIINETESRFFVAHVSKLLEDSDFDVKKNAIVAVGKMKHLSLLPKLFSFLPDFNLRETTINAFKDFGIKAHREVERFILSPSADYGAKKVLISYLWLSGNDGIKVLWRVLDKMPFALRYDIVRHFNQSEIGLEKYHKNILSKLIEQDFKNSVLLLRLYEDFTCRISRKDKQVYSLLADALDKDFERVRRLLLMQFYLYFKDNISRQAISNLLRRDAPSDDKIVSSAIMEDILPRRWQKIKWVVMDGNDMQRLSFLPKMKHQRLKTILTLPYASAWTKLCAVYLIGCRGEGAFLSDVKKLKDDKNKLLARGAVWADKKIEDFLKKE